MEKSIYSEEYAAFLRCLIQARKQAGLTQVQLAQRLNVTQTLISKCERGERRIDIVELERICRALRITLVDFSQQLTVALSKTKPKRRRRE